VKESDKQIAFAFLKSGIQGQDHEFAVKQFTASSLPSLACASPSTFISVMAHDSGYHPTTFTNHLS